MACPITQGGHNNVCLPSSVHTVCATLSQTAKKAVILKSLLYSVDLITGGVLFIVGIGVVLGVISGSFMLAVIFVIRHRYSTLIAIVFMLSYSLSLRPIRRARKK